jgi:arginine deiminase
MQIVRPDSSEQPRPDPKSRGPSYSFSVNSEYGVLKKVLVHAPGHEMELVSPENHAALLFDDILFVGQARREHLLMCDVIEKVIGRADSVLQIATLLRETLELEDARHSFVEDTCRSMPEANLGPFEGELKRLSPAELVDFALAGTSPLPISMQPLPNLIFTRDLAAVVNDHIILSHAARTARVRETVIIDVVMSYHPGFAKVRDKIIRLPEAVTFEGGDLIVAREDVVLIGHSERTSLTGAMDVARALFARTQVQNVLLVDLPKKRSCMHLDTVFTFASEDECVVFPPMIDREDLGNVVSFSRSDDPQRFYTEVRPNLKDALEGLLGRELTFIPCGGNEPLSQRREQWTDGANFFALAPGVVVGYERNRRTFETMQKHGYRVVSAQGFLDYHEESPYEAGEKMAIKLEGYELSRGRGGPRCMTLPLARESV